jgi:predicted amidophosphoribosyltransferase
MGLFRRNKPEPKKCPQCMQLLDPDALVCDMCGFDMRELQPVVAGGPTASTAEERFEPKH